MYIYRTDTLCVQLFNHEQLNFVMLMFLNMLVQFALSSEVRTKPNPPPHGAD